MRVLVASPGNDVTQSDIDDITRDLEKIDRRLADFKEEITAQVRVNPAEGGAPGVHVVIELHYGRFHLVATVDHADLGQAVRQAREDLLRQINDRSRGGHSSFAKGL